MSLSPLPKEKIISKLKNMISAKLWNLSITLVTGDLLIGSFFPEWELKSEKNKNKIWIPNHGQKQPEEFCHGLVFENSFKIVFNSPKGTVHGDANLVEVPFDKIADIRKLRWDNPDINKRGLKNISNPLASIINKCNTRAAKRNSLTVILYVEMALAREEIGDEGISFSEDELIYIDIAFFNDSQSSFSIGPMSFGSSIGAYTLADIKMRNSIVQKSLRGLSRGIVKPINISGYIRCVEEEKTTNLEGEDCFVVLCKLGSSFLPVFLKRDLLLYPFEYMDLIKSSLIFYGEFKQIPIKIKGIEYSKVLLARAIAYIKDLCT